MAAVGAVGAVLAFLLAVGAPAITNDPDKSVCEHWSDVATQMTGSGRTQICVNNKTATCARLDCTGTVTFKHPLFSDVENSAIEIDYCFGSVLNSCLEPISMDFYLQIPAKNVTFSRRIRHDTDVEITAISFPVTRLGKAYPVLYFEFERQPDGNIEYSVTSKVKLDTAAGSMFLNQLETSLIDEETIHALSCDKLINDTADKPAAELVLGQCHEEKYSPPAGSSKNKGSYSPSATLNKSCGISKKCDPREMCDLSRDKPVCVCRKESRQSPKGDACLSTSRVAQPCRQMDDCSYYEECLQGRCRCQEGYAYNHVHQMCIWHQPGTPTEAPPGGGKHPPSPASPSVPTQQPHSGEVNGTSSHDGGKKGVLAELPPIIGGVLGGVALLALAMWGFIYIRKRRLLRNRLDTALGMHDESEEALLGDTDDMIM